MAETDTAKNERDPSAVSTGCVILPNFRLNFFSHFFCLAEIDNDKTNKIINMHIYTRIPVRQCKRLDHGNSYLPIHASSQQVANAIFL